MNGFKRVLAYATKEARKTLAAATTGAGALLAAGLLHGPWLIGAVALVAITGTAAVHQVTNTPPS